MKLSFLLKPWTALPSGEALLLVEPTLSQRCFNPSRGINCIQCTSAVRSLFFVLLVSERFRLGLRHLCEQLHAASQPVGLGLPLCVSSPFTERGLAKPKSALSW